MFGKRQEYDEQLRQSPKSNVEDQTENAESNWGRRIFFRHTIMI